MGQLCSKPNGDAVVESKQPPSDSNGDQAPKMPSKELVESFQQKFRGTVYFSAIEDIDAENLALLDQELPNLDKLPEVDEEGKEVELEEGGEDSGSLEYPPATIANRHLRATVYIDKESTLLREDQKPKQKTASAIFMNDLKQPSSSHAKARGYPGELTVSEMETCLALRKRVKEMKDSSHYDMVKSLEPAEEEPYGFCRFLRARDFDLEETLEMMDEALPLWKAAAAEDFYPTMEKAIGCTDAVLYTQFPSVPVGIAKNGTLVSYLRVGNMSTEGIECITDVDKLNRLGWMRSKPRAIKSFTLMQERHPDAVLRCELTYVVDLTGLSTAQVNKKSIDACQNMFQATACFPEVLNKVVVLNAPSFFSMVWRMVKVFLHPRTAKKIEIFSTGSKGNKRLQQLIDAESIPSDYGGKAALLEDLGIQRYCQKGCRQKHELLHLPKKGKSKDWTFELQSKEQATVTVYTRSSDGADFTIQHSSKTVKAVVTDSSKKHCPYVKEIASGIRGPGKVSVTATSKSPQPAYFLVIATISPA